MPHTTGAGHQLPRPHTVRCPAARIDPGSPAAGRQRTFGICIEEGPGKGDFRASPRSRTGRHAWQANLMMRSTAAFRPTMRPRTRMPCPRLAGRRGVTQRGWQTCRSAQRTHNRWRGERYGEELWAACRGGCRWVAVLLCSAAVGRPVRRPHMWPCTLRPQETLPIRGRPPRRRHVAGRLFQVGEGRRVAACWKPDSRPPESQHAMRRRPK
jgi:hypothetical protein